MTLSKIRIEMARNHDFPEGSALHGYEFVAPLDKKGHIDAKVMAAASQPMPRQTLLGR